MEDDERYVCFFEELSASDVGWVGGKNASLGEMTTKLGHAGIRVPGGFAITAAAYRRFLAHNELDSPLGRALRALADGAPVAVVGARVRSLLSSGEWPLDVAEAIREAYRELSRRHERVALDVAVRSSATAEDLPDASFAGQQETFLNIEGEGALLDACRRCCASLFTDRAIEYREARSFDQRELALSVGVQKMVRSDRACAGVMFTLDTETGFPDVVLVDGSWGLGEGVVSGLVDPDRFEVYAPLLDRDGVVPIVQKKLGAKQNKVVYARGGEGTTRVEDTTPAERASFVLSDEEILRLARWGRAIQAHYGRPMDIEWAKDGESGQLFIVQARPETVQSRRPSRSLRTYTLLERAEPLVVGVAVGSGIGAGRAFVLESPREAGRFEDGGVLVTSMTDPDWLPIMRRASAVVTDHGGRTSHAAILSRELGVPAVIGTGNATEAIADADELTVSCAEGEEGRVYRGILAHGSTVIDLASIPKTRTKVMLNLSNPQAAYRWWSLPADGVALARLEFLIGQAIRVHPMAFVAPERVEDEEVRARIAEITRGFEEPVEYFVDTLARGIAKIACSRYPDPVIVRFSDFKSNEHAQLIGGASFETPEQNPMLGFRGASRYYDARYRDAFVLECRALRRAREELGFRNVAAAIPFCRSPEEADRVLEVLAQNGLERGRDGLELYVMAEIPSNVILAREFARRFDGFSIGSNDLTQLTLGVDRDSEQLAHLFDQRSDAVLWMIRRLISEAHAVGARVGICGQAPSDYPDLAALLVEAGIDSISVDPTSFAAVREVVARAEGAAAELATV